MILSGYIKPLLALVVIAVIVGIAAVVFRNGSSVSGPVKSVNQQLPRNIDVVLKKARFSEIKDGKVEWELVAERVDYDKSGNTAYLSDIRMMFPKTGSHEPMTVTADKGEYTSLDKTVHLNGHVNVVAEDGASFKTNSLLYTGASAHFSTTDPITFRQQRLQLTAVGMNLGVDDQQARFFSLVDAIIVMK
jgi:LPS export ABC transporter protein LptC